MKVLEDERNLRLSDPTNMSQSTRSIPKRSYNSQLGPASSVDESHGLQRQPRPIARSYDFPFIMLT